MKLFCFWHLGVTDLFMYFSFLFTKGKKKWSRESGLCKCANCLSNPKRSLEILQQCGAATNPKHKVM